MKFSTHIITAVSVSTALVAFDVLPSPSFQDLGLSGISSFFLFWGIIAFSSLIPDIDHGNSFISNKLGISLSWLFKHRGFTHYIYFWGALIYYGLTNSGTYPEISLWVGVGALLHSYGDMHTKGGVKLFGFGKSMTILPSVLAFKTGGFTETLVSGGYVALFGYSCLILFG